MRRGQVLCGHHVLIWIWSTGQRVRMSIHGAPLCLSLYSASLPSFERACHPLHTHTLSGTHKTHTKEEGLNLGRESSHVHCPVFQSSSPVPVVLYLSTFQFSAVPSALSSHKDLVYSATCIYLREESRGGRYGKHLGPACCTFLPSGFSTSEHRPPLCFDVL